MSIRHNKIRRIRLGLTLILFASVPQIHAAELFYDSFESPDIAPTHSSVPPSGWTGEAPAILANVASIEIRSSQPTYLQISEVIATETGSGSDLALASAGATASGSGNYSSSSNPDKTIDGTGPSAYPNIYHSNGTSASEFLKITLATPSTLDSLTIMGRTNCCSNRDVYDIYFYDNNGALLFSSTDYSADNNAHSFTVNFPASGPSGAGGVIDEGSGWLTTPYGEQVVWINSGSFTTTSSNLSAVLTADVTYTLSVNVAKRNDLGGNYNVELLAGSTVLGTATGTPTQSDFSETDEIVFTAGSGHANLGQTLQIRLSTNGALQPQFDNIRLTADDGLLSVATGDVSQGYEVSSYGGAQDQSGTVEVKDADLSLYLEGNRWQKIDFPYTVTPYTVIEFDFQSTDQGEIHGLGFDNDLVISPNLSFKLYGTQNWGLSDFATYTGSGITHFSIPVGEYYTGNFQYLFFMNDDDSNPTGNSLYSNIVVHEGSQLTGMVNIDNRFSAYISTSDSVQGTLIASGSTWTVTESLATNLVAGQDYYLHIYAEDTGGPAGFLGDFTLSGGTLSGGSHRFENGGTSLTTDTSNWRVSRSGWSSYQSASGYGQNGVSPWGLRSDVDANATWIWSSNNNDHNTNYFTTKIKATSPLAAHYQMEEASWGAVLDSQSGFNGTAYNGANTTGGGNCRYGQFDGVDDYVQIPHDPALNGSDALTYMAYVRPDSWSVTNNQIMAKSVHGGGQGRVQMGMFSEGGVLKGRAETLNGRYDISTTLPLVDGDWVHIAMVFNGTSLILYADGTAVASTTFSSTTLKENSDPLNISKRVGTDQYFFHGLIDDVRVYTRALTAQEIRNLVMTVTPCPIAGVDHYAISHATPGLTCEASLITVTAHDASHNLVSVVADTDLTITTSPVVDSIVSSPATITAGNSSTSLYLNQGSLLSNIDIDVTDGSASDLDDAGSEDPVIEFLDTAFRFYTNGSSATYIGTQIAGKGSDTAPGAQSLTLRAVRANTDTGACEAALQGTTSVNVAYECNNPTTCTANNLLTFTGATSATISRNNNGTVSKTYVLVDMTFDASGEAPFSFNFADAGKITLHVEKTVAANSPEPEFILIGGSNPLVTRPFGFNLDFNDADSSAVDHDGSAFKTAGSDFDMQVTAVNWQAGDDANNDGIPDNGADLSAGNSTAFNFGQETSANTLVIDHTLVLPTLTTGDSGSFSATTLNAGGGTSSFTGGTATTTLNWDEVGIIDIGATLNNYLADTGADIATTAANVGRFYPASFSLTITDATFDQVCNSLFTYLDQDFQFDTAPTVTINALNGAGGLTQNYEGNFWKLGANLQEQSTCSGLGSTKGFCYTDNVSGLASLSRPNSAQSYGADLTNINGEVTLTLHNQPTDQFQYQRPVGSNLVPFDADVQLIIELSDEDGVIGTQTLANIGFSGDPDTGNKNATNQKFLRHGRWKMENAYGPETHALKLKTYAQHFSVSNRFELNVDDNCTAFSSTDITLTPTGTGATIFDDIVVGGGSSSLTLNSPLSAGDSENFSFSAPLAGNTGTIDIDVNLDTLPWLKFDWDNDNDVDKHPQVQAIFGQYRGHDRIIYWREVSN